MRPDMAKVIVERPRYGSRMRGQGKGYWRDLQRVPADELPKRERIKQSHRSMGKSLNEHLSPLRRYLLKQIGRPWNKVFAEICQYISRDSAVQDHVRDHVFDYVAAKIIIIDGVLYESTKWGGLFPLFTAWRNPVMYVCPTTGLLKRGKQASRRQRRNPPQLPTVHIPLDYEISFIRHAGVWQRVRFEPFPMHIQTDHSGLPILPFDALRREPLPREDAVRHYGRAVVAMEVRAATRHEIRKYCEPLKAPNRV